MPAHSIVPDPAGLNSEIAQLLEEAGGALDSDSAAARSLIMRASALLRGQRADLAAQTQTRRRGGLAPWQAQRVIKHIDAALGSKIRISALASMTRLSENYFGRAFRCTFGESPYGYIVRRRVERAQETMLRTDDALSEIALACGFSDQAHMTKLFRQMVGRSPGAWRRDRCEAFKGEPRSARALRNAKARAGFHKTGVGDVAEGAVGGAI
jgi:AraC family transcriptional regulator